MKTIKFYVTAIIITLVFLASCGYHFEGGGYLNDDVSSVAVLFFKNNSSETGAGITFTNALVEEISSKSDTVVVEESAANVVIEAQIKSINFAILSRSTTESVIERRVTSVVDVKMKDKQGEVLWYVKDFSTSEDYTVSDDAITDETNKREAIDEVAQRCAEQLVSKMLTNF